MGSPEYNGYPDNRPEGTDAHGAFFSDGSVDAQFDGVVPEEPADGYGGDIEDHAPGIFSGPPAEFDENFARYTFEEGMKVAKIINDFESEGNTRISFFGWEALIETVPVDEHGRRPDLIGGFGVTRRPLEEIADTLPGIKEELLAVDGKILILGNGLSLAPLEVISQRGPDNQPDITIVDALQYGKLYDDLKRIQAQCAEAGVEAPPRISESVQRCEAILQAAQRGELKIVEHLFGSGQVPESIKGADLAISSYGPPQSTIPQQVECLKTGGRLYSTTTFPHPDTIGKAVARPVPKTTEKASGLIYTKLPTQRRWR